MLDVQCAVLYGRMCRSGHVELLEQDPKGRGKINMVCLVLVLP